MHTILPFTETVKEKVGSGSRGRTATDEEATKGGFSSPSPSGALDVPARMSARS